MPRSTSQRPHIPVAYKRPRARLAPDQVRDLALVHNMTLDALAKGHAGPAVMWELVEGALTWSRVADLIHLDQDEMRGQLELATRVVERYGATGRVALEGLEYDVARHGVMVMDELASRVDVVTAIAAAEWSERRLVVLMSATQRAAEAA